jgi:hypothetical protein
MAVLLSNDHSTNRLPDIEPCTSNMQMRLAVLNAALAAAAHAAKSGDGCCAVLRN